MAKQIGLKELFSESDPDGWKREVSFEDGLKLLEELVAKVESGTLPLDKAVIAYEKGVALVEHLRSMLSGAEEKLKVLQKPMPCPPSGD